jgi:MoaA/NifB/PqqE/SkfB family radical SAM enzyme
LRVTIWATDSREYAALHPGTNPAHLERRIEGISRVLDARRARGRTLPRVHFMAPLNRANCAGVDVRVRHAIQAGCDSLYFSYYRAFGREFESLCLTPEDLGTLEAALRRAKRDLRAAGLAENVDEYRTLLSLGRHEWRRTPCHAGWIQASIYADGRVQACNHCDLVVGDLSTQSFAEIWHGREFRKFRRTVSRPGGAAAYGRSCECEDCCHMKDNLRMHRVFRWLAPLASMTRTPERQ